MEAAEENLTELDNTIALLREGEKKTLLMESHKNVTLVLGISGSGKSTLLQWLYGDSTKLVAKKIGQKYIITDGDDRISAPNETIQSKTQFPELVIDAATDSAFYDCPGFSDTRSPSVDIASSYFIKQVTDHADFVKIILTIGYPAVTLGGDRQGLQLLLAHTAEFIKDVDKFQNSIMLVVTKVENKLNNDNNGDDDDVGGRYITDAEIIMSIAKFLKDAKISLKYVRNDNDKENNLRNSKRKIIDLILANPQGNYPKIQLFRQPTARGSLSDSKLLEEAKPKIKKAIHENLEFAKTNKNDFKFSISNEAKAVVSKVIEKFALKQNNSRIANTFLQFNEKYDLSHIPIPSGRGKRNVKAVTSGAQQKTIFFGGLAHYLNVQIREYFAWATAAVSSTNDALLGFMLPSFEETSEHRISVGKYNSFNDAILLSQLVLGAIMKDYRPMRNVSYVSPHNTILAQEHHLAEHVLKLIQHAHHQYD